MALLNKAQQQQQAASLTTNQLPALTQSNSNPLLQLQHQSQISHAHHNSANTLPATELTGSVVSSLNDEIINYSISFQGQVVNAVLGNSVNQGQQQIQDVRAEFRSESQESRDDENFDYRITIGEIINHRQELKEASLVITAISGIELRRTSEKDLLEGNQTLSN